ncbi:MAG: epoxyqueuosine reductase QueH [Clostridia bacterium]|nr:epoxyqueuosine reductase QueH [Clostridia bacterium]
MKTRYQAQLDALLPMLEGKPRLFLHSCCGPCSTYVLEYLAQYFEITLFYYNPNIYPAEEYQHRLATQKEVLERTGWATLVEGEYDHSDFLAAVRGYEAEPEGGARCEFCFRLRMEEAAKLAQDSGYDYFATTLSVSPHKDAALLGKIGEELEARYGVKHLPSDFKKREGYKRSVSLSNEMGLYRQDYCGCEFSLRDARKSKS